MLGGLFRIYLIGRLFNFLTGRRRHGGMFRHSGWGSRHSGWGHRHHGPGLLEMFARRRRSII